MYTIKHASEVTGLSPATLRAWERRYGVVTPHRTEAGYRLYDEQTFRALTLMAALVAQGWSPRQAADETRRRLESGEARVTEPAAPPPLATTSNPPGSPVTGSSPESRTTSNAPGPALTESATRPAATVSATSELHGVPSPSAAVHGPALVADAQAFVEAAARLDVPGLSAILDARFSLASFESVVDSWLMPSLVKLGEGWAQGSVSVAGEHLASYAVMRRLAAAYDASSAGATGPTVVVGLPPGARHELGVLAFAVAARRAGLRAVYLGADLPADDWVTAVLTHRPRAVVLSAMQATDVSALDRVVQQLRDVSPGLIVAVGGALQDRAPEGCLLLGHQIGAGAARLAETLAATLVVPPGPQHTPAV